MALLQDLIAQIEDKALRERITTEVDKLTKFKKFGLVFEGHLPECTPLYDIPVKRGSLVAIKKGYVRDIYTVLKIEGENVLCDDRKTHEKKKFTLNELVVVAEFGEPIYPFLKPIDSICNAPKSDLWHTLIEADNYHALQLLEYLYADKVDCIYIDPPYNTGNKDWKYNNNYVDDNDTYRHSKWLSMMEKRLRIAKRLLSSDGVLIVAIDDNELNTLGLLLQELFPEYDSFCITVIQNPNGNQGKNFGRTNEFAFFLVPTGRQVLSLEDRSDNPIVLSLRDLSGNNNMRTDAKNCFYPIYIKEGAIIGFGDVCDNSFHPDSINVTREDGVIEVYPIDSNGNERKWTFARQTVESILGELYVKWNDSGKFYDIIRIKTATTYKTVWNKKSYNANGYGSKLINSILGEERFNYPKSLYTVYECVRAVCKDRPNALVVDFFAGSGTTLHAVNLLNAEDGGHRRCVIVTNNEVSEKEAKSLTKRGLHPGDKEWEDLGIARHVAWPRTVCSIKGQDINGLPLKGNYGVETETYGEVDEDDGIQVLSAKTGNPLKRKLYKRVKRPTYPELAKINQSDGFKANAVYFKLGFLDKTAVALGRQFAELLPILWMKSGAAGKCPSLSTDELPKMLILPENHFAVLLDESAYLEFAQKVAEQTKIKTIYFVTDSVSAYGEMAKAFEPLETCQLYSNYLDNFRINTRKSL